MDSVRNPEILFEMILEVRILLMLGLLDESVLSMLFIKDLSSYEYWFGIGPYAPFTIFNAKNWRLFATKGGLNAQI